ncbi:MAG: hypothetical protein ACLSVD_17070 [Eggerthellaceae bacterium]
MPVRLIGVAMTGFGGGESVQDSLFDIAEAAPSDDDVDPSSKTRRSGADSSRQPTSSRTSSANPRSASAASCEARATPPAPPARTGRLQVGILKAKPDASDMQPRTLRESRPEEVGRACRAQFRTNRSVLWTLRASSGLFEHGMSALTPTG